MSDQATAAPRFGPDALRGTRILVTGGGTGLGRGITQRLLEYGADVHIWGRRPAVLEQATDELAGEFPGRIHHQCVDIRSAADTESALDALWSAHGPLTGLVNNAAANFMVRSHELTPGGFQAVASTVMNGSFNATVGVGKRWIAAGQRGAVVSTITSYALTGSPFVVPSAMAKAAVEAMTKSLAVEWARNGIRLNAVAPGPIPTEFAWAMLNPTGKSSEMGPTSSELVPMGRYGTVEELGNLYAFLLSGACNYLTGQTIVMDGGQQLAGNGTFSGLTALTDEDWRAIRSTSSAASAKSKSERQTTP